MDVLILKPSMAWGKADLSSVSQREISSFYGLFEIAFFQRTGELQQALAKA